MKRVMVFAGTVGGALVLWTAAAAAATSGPQSFILTSPTGGGHQGTITAAGPVHGTGVDRVINNNTDRFVFPRQGSVLVNHQATSSHPGPEVGCVFFYSERGTYSLAGGTGQYVGASGGGTYRVSDVFFATPTSKGCSGRNGTDFLVIAASGHTTLP